MISRKLNLFIAKRLAGAALLIFVLSTCTVMAQGAQVDISVGLESGITTGTISSSGAITAVDASGRRVNLGKSVNFRAESGLRTLVMGKTKASLPVTFTSSRYLSWKGRPYRGLIRLVPSTKGLAVVNVLPVEDYLKGVLKMEVNPAWPMEVLKAQAIVARTYAIKGRGRHKSEGFDLCALPHCQVYRGVNAEDPKLNQAIKVTSGMVITYQGNLALVFYHADSGGYTADVKDVWGGSYPYLRPVAEPFSYQSPYSQWSLSLPLKEIENRLRRAGFDVGVLLGLQFESTSPGGRVDSVILNGSMGTQKISGHAFRMALGPNELRSTTFSVDGIQPKAVATNPTSSPTTPSSASSNAGENTLIALTKQGCFTPDELIDMLMHPEKRQHYVQKALSKRKSPILPSIPTPTVTPTPTRTAGGIVSFYGRGWGHGVGMSQWGAKAMAERGWSARQILNHYYPNTEISKLY